MINSFVEVEMLKKLFLGLLLLTMLACSSGRLLPATPTVSPDAEEQVVYAALLQEMYPAGRYVLTDTTQSDILPGSVDDELGYVLEQVQGVDTSTIAGFRMRNDQSSLLRADMNLGAPYILLSETDMNAIFGGSQDGWEVFYSRYPDAPGIITFSRVGFNAVMDQALVYVGNQSHWLAGAGYYVLLEKVDGVWTITQQVMTWIS
jgi:hypothetical protein